MYIDLITQHETSNWFRNLGSYSPQQRAAERTEQNYAQVHKRCSSPREKHIHVKSVQLLSWEMGSGGFLEATICSLLANCVLAESFSRHGMYQCGRDNHIDKLWRESHSWDPLTEARAELPFWL